MKQDVIVALVVCIGAAILIIFLFLGILLQKRQPDRQRRRNKKTNNGYVNRSYAKDDVEMVPPPIETVVITISSSSTGIGTTGAFSSFTSDTINQRPGLEKSISERSGDVWQLRQDDRKEYILENILYKKVTHSKLFGTLYLPHLDDLSSRVRSNSHDVNDANNNNTKSFEPTIQYIQDIENSSSSKGNNDKNNNNKNEKKKYTTDTPNCNHEGGGCGATETTPAITMTSGESQGPSSQEASSSQQHHTYSHRACPICMEPYESGDTVCWSRNENCPHAFHLECKVDYLLNTDECILCRNNFVLNIATATTDGDDKGLDRTMDPATTTTINLP